MAINDNQNDTPEDGQPNGQEVEAAYQDLQGIMSKEMSKCCISCITAALVISEPGIMEVAAAFGDPYPSIFSAYIKSEVVSFAATEPYIYYHWCCDDILSLSFVHLRVKR